ncbi:uncharacterized protein QC764_0104630 [Podospora pseudoanserina]|uniref:Uncharacterized protein n=1 Tax=Podospora pseudoanserina TaxID=2609844 RepID=A0ABR0HL47_9PEZI|nr:hypothetical protein QC764_0104630 [Podospora pseudoanserina]
MHGSNMRKRKEKKRDGLTVLHGVSTVKLLHDRRTHSNIKSKAKATQEKKNTARSPSKGCIFPSLTSRPSLSAAARTRCAGPSSYTPLVSNH